MIEQLFGSKTRVKLLHLFYTNPGRSFYVREITRKIEEQINSVRRELGNLQTIGLVSSSSSANRLYYEVNQNYVHYKPMKLIFSNMDEAEGSLNVADNDLARRFQALGSVDLALLSGAFTRDQDAPIDILVVGDINMNQFEKLVAELEGDEGRELRYSVLDSREYQYRVNLNDRFITTVLDSKTTILVEHHDHDDNAEPNSEPASNVAAVDSEQDSEASVTSEPIEETETTKE